MATERDRMLGGVPFQSYDPELKAERHATEVLLWELDHTHPDNQEERQRIIAKLFGSVGNEFDLRLPFRIEYGKNTVVGDNVYIGPYCALMDAGGINIGDRVIIGSAVRIGTTDHSLNPAKRQQFDTARPVTIGADVYIGGGTTIAPGVTVGNGSVVGACSFVNKDVPSGVLAYGVPSRVIRSISK